jgi:tetratricopeptide (TPR) repeat protein
MDESATWAALSTSAGLDRPTTATEAVLLDSLLGQRWESGPETGQASPPGPEHQPAHSDADLLTRATADDLGRLRLDGLDHLKGGDYAMACACFRLDLRCRLKAPTGSASDNLAAAGRLGEALWAGGHLSEARSIQQLVLDTARRLLGENHPQCLAATNDLGVTLHDQGHLPAARELLQTAYDTRQKVLGQDAIDTLISGDNLSNVVRDQGDLAAARLFQESIVQAFKRSHGPTHPDTLTAVNNLALTMRDQGDLVSARALQEAEYQTCKELLGDDHPDTLTSASNLALTIRGLGDVALARAMEEEVLRTRERVLGADHADTLLAANNLAEAVRELGDLEYAQQLHEQVRAQRQRVLGSHHPDTLTSASNLAEVLRAQGNAGDARDIHASVRDLRAHLLGADHPDTLTSASRLALALQDLGDMAGSAATSLDVLQVLIDSPMIDSESLWQGVECPLLSYPDASWPSDAIELTGLRLPELSAAVQRQLRPMRLDASAPLYLALTGLHVAWCELARRHAPGPRLPALLLQIVAPLHGQNSWVEARQGLEAHPSISATEATASYLRAETDVTQVRCEIEQRRRDLSSLRSRIAALEHDGKAPATSGAHESLTDLLLAAARADEELQLRELVTLIERDRAAQHELRAREDQLATEDSGLAARLQAMRGLTMRELDASLHADDTWVTPLPDPNISTVADHEQLIAALEDRRSLVLVHRAGREPEIVEVASIQLLRVLNGRYCQGLRGRGLSSLRDEGQLESQPLTRPLDNGEHLKDLPAAPPSNDPVGSLAGAFEQGFWRPLSHMLQGSRRVHLVTPPGAHDLMFEAGLSKDLSHLRVHRYCGLPAYKRRLMSEAAASPAEPSTTVEQWAWLFDQAWSTGRPIPFTELDAVLPGRRRMVRSQSASELKSGGPISPRLLISSHGQSIGEAENPSGSLVVGNIRLDPSDLTRLRGRRSPTHCLVSLSCFGGVVGVGPQGDPHGVIAALQHDGLLWGVACLAPVSDFHAPVLSALLHHGLEDARLDPSDALHEAKRLLLWGPWTDDLHVQVLRPLRAAYAPVMRHVIEHARYVPNDEKWNRQARRLLLSLAGWTLPVQVRRDFFSSDARWLVQAHGDISSSLFEVADEREGLIETCLDALFKSPERRDESDRDVDGPMIAAFRALCAATVFFGRAGRTSARRAETGDLVVAGRQDADPHAEDRFRANEADAVELAHSMNQIYGPASQ